MTTHSVSHVLVAFVHFFVNIKNYIHLLYYRDFEALLHLSNMFLKAGFN